MRRFVLWRRLPWFWISVCALLLFACAAFLSTLPGQVQHLAPASGRLPGEQIWKQGISSFLFGTNDTYEWSATNIETRPEIRVALRRAGFTLLRSFFRDGASDASIEQRISTIEQVGAHCLAVITNIFDLASAEHLVRVLGDRCQLYEFGNEPDYTGIAANSYLQQWQRAIPLLRAINPRAAFIGPTLSRANLVYLQTFLTGVRTSGILPDAISFHWYPCSHTPQALCLQRIASVGQQAQAVRALVRTILGRELPVGVSEWNADPDNPPASYVDSPEFSTRFTTQVLQVMQWAGVDFACQFDAASFAGYGRLDMFDQQGQGKAQYAAMAQVIARARP